MFLAFFIIGQIIEIILWHSAADSRLENTPEAVAQFLTDYQTSIEYIHHNIDDGAALVEKYGIVPQSAIAKAAISKCNMMVSPFSKIYNTPNVLTAAT